MPKRIAIRLLAVALILSVGLFAMQAAGHWHEHSSDEQHCQVCHIGHARSPAARGADGRADARCGRRDLPFAENQKLSLDPVCSHRIPRAPPV